MSDCALRVSKERNTRLSTQGVLCRPPHDLMVRCPAVRLGRVFLTAPLLSQGIDEIVRFLFRTPRGNRVAHGYSCDGRSRETRHNIAKARILLGPYNLPDPFRMCSHKSETDQVNLFPNAYLAFGATPFSTSSGYRESSRQLSCMVRACTCRRASELSDNRGLWLTSADRCRLDVGAPLASHAVSHYLGVVGSKW